MKVGEGNRPFSKVLKTDKKWIPNFGVLCGTEEDRPRLILQIHAKFRDLTPRWVRALFQMFQIFWNLIGAARQTGHVNIIRHSKIGPDPSIKQDRVNLIACYIIGYMYLFIYETLCSFQNFFLMSLLLAFSSLLSLALFRPGEDDAVITTDNAQIKLVHP